MNRQVSNVLARGVLVMSVMGASAMPVHAAAAVTASAHSHPMKVQALHDGMRKLWEDHVLWTRLFIISAAADLPDKAATTDRLLQNQVDIGNAIKPYYGVEAGEKLTSLLKEHIMIAAELVTAAKAGETAKMTDANGRWKTNANAIAAFLGAANPKHWPRAEMEQMMNEHLSVTTAEVQARLKGDWTADIAAYDRVHEQILAMADMLSSGVAAQFPEKLK